MLSEDFFAAVCGPPLTSNTAIARDVGIYHHTLSPAHAVQATFKKSTAPVGGLAVSPSHAFAAQQDRAYVHVYSRLRGGQEAAVSLSEKVRCLALAGDVLVVGTAEGRLILWETLSGRLITTPPCHVQAVSCLATTPYHVLSGSDDSNVHVWSLPQLLALGGSTGAGLGNGDQQGDEPEPEQTLARHRAAVTSLAVGGGTNRDTNLCVSASRDKTIVLWNYQTGVALRTLLLPAVPLCVVLDPVARALYVATTDDDASSSGKKSGGDGASAAAGRPTAAALSTGSLYAVELFGDKPLLGARGAEAASTAVSISTPFGIVPSDAGPASCLAVSYDGTTLLSGHPRGRILQWNLGDAGGSSTLPVELSNLNAAVTNLIFVPPLPTNQTASVVPPRTSVQTVVKPKQGGSDYSVTVRFDEPSAADAALQGETAAFDALVNLPGFPREVLDNAILSFQQQLGGDGADGGSSSSRRDNSKTAAGGDGDPELRRQNEELLEILDEQSTLFQEAQQRIAELEAARS